MRRVRARAPRHRTATLAQDATTARRAGARRMTGGPPLVAPLSPRHRVAMADPPRPATLDEALGLRALEALLDSDLERAARVLAHARRSNRLAFVLRLALVVPSAAVRLARG